MHDYLLKITEAGDTSLLELKSNEDNLNWRVEQRYAADFDFDKITCKRIWYESNKNKRGEWERQSEH